MNPLIGLKKATPVSSRLVCSRLRFTLALGNRDTAGCVPS